MTEILNIAETWVALTGPLYGFSDADALWLQQTAVLQGKATKNWITVVCNDANREDPRFSIVQATAKEMQPHAGDGQPYRMEPIPPGETDDWGRM